MIQSLINPQCTNMIRACGALLNFLDRTKVGGLNLEGNGGVAILAIRPYTPQDIVRIDETTLSALQIFNCKWQNSGEYSFKSPEIMLKNGHKFKSRTGSFLRIIPELALNLARFLSRIYPEFTLKSSQKNL